MSGFDLRFSPLLHSTAHALNGEYTQGVSIVVDPADGLTYKANTDAVKAAATGVLGDTVVLSTLPSNGQGGAADNWVLAKESYLWNTAVRNTVDIANYFTMGDTAYKTRFYDTTNNKNSGGEWTPTGTVDALSAGLGHHSDGYVYDAAGNQFECLSRDVNKHGFDQDPTVDNSAAYVVLRDHMALFNGGTMTFESGEYRGNFAYRERILHEGKGRATTTLRPYSDSLSLFYAMSGVTPQRHGWRDMQLLGFSTFDGDSHGINCSEEFPTNYFFLERLIISGFSGCGVRSIGEGGAVGSPHMQLLMCAETTIRKCLKEGVYMIGNNLENHFVNSFITNNGLDGVSDNFRIERGDGANSVSTRTTLKNVVLNAPGTTGSGLYVSGVANLVIDTCDFEQCNKGVTITSNDIERVKNITIRNSTFQHAAGEVDEYSIYYDYANGLVIDNNEFKCVGDGTTLTNFIKGDPLGVVRAIGVDIRPTNSFEVDDTATVTKYIDIKKNLTVIDDGQVEIQAIERIVHLSALSNSSRTIETINGIHGSTDEFVPSHIITLVQASNTRTYTITSAGNISLDADVVLSSTGDSLSLVWSGDEWLKVG